MRGLEEIKKINTSLESKGIKTIYLQIQKEDPVKELGIKNIEKELPAVILFKKHGKILLWTEGYNPSIGELLENAVQVLGGTNGDTDNL